MGKWPKLKTGLNPYGVPYHLGLLGHGSDRQNPDGKGLPGLLELASSINASALEIFNPWIQNLDDAGLHELKSWLSDNGVTPIISGGHITNASDAEFDSAEKLGAKTIRYALTNVLCGDRAERGDWDELRAQVAQAVKTFGQKAADQAIYISIENHQDFTAQELVEFCQSAPNVGITYDTGNSFPVAQSPLDFTRIIAPYVRHVHLKDYRVQPTPEGFRLVRCAIGDGAIPFKELFDILGEHQSELTAALEPGALEVRHVRLLTPNWWQGYAPQSAQDLAACLLATKVNALPPEEDYRTPWEKGEDDKIADYELQMFAKSAANMKYLGIFKE